MVRIPSVAAATAPASVPPAGVLPRLSLVLGGARSGKSVYAETLIEGARPAGESAIYLATAQANDTEMAARIRAHRARRGEDWATVEEPLALDRALARESRPGRPVLVDCLTLWLANLMAAARDVPAECDRLLAALAALPGPAVLVSNEVGLGIVPDNPMAREFRDHAGRLHQRIAAAADFVVFVAAGLPLSLKYLPSESAR